MFPDVSIMWLIIISIFWNHEYACICVKIKYKGLRCFVWYFSAVIIINTRYVYKITRYAYKIKRYAYEITRCACRITRYAYKITRRRRLAIDTLWQTLTGDRWIPAQMASNAENVSIWWRHHGSNLIYFWICLKSFWWHVSNIFDFIIMLDIYHVDTEFLRFDGWHSATCTNDLMGDCRYSKKIICSPIYIYLSFGFYKQWSW